MLRRVSLVLWLLTLTVVAGADSRARIVRLSYLEGDVELDRRDGHGFNRAFINMPVVEGARLWTRDDARVEVEFEDGSTIRLAPGTILEFRELRLRDGGDRSTLIDMQEGVAYFNIGKHGGDDFRLVFGQQQVTPLKASRFRFDLSREQLQLAVFRGELELLRRNGERVQVRKNETLSLSFEDADRYYLARGVTEGAQDYWDREREQERERYAREQSRRVYYPAAYSYGYPDLYRYAVAPLWRWIVLGSIRRRLLGLVSALWIRLGLALSLGMDPISLRLLGERQRTRLVLAFRPHL